MADDKELFHIVSTSRSIRTRTVRARNATHAGLKQFIGGQYRLIRNRPLVLPKSEVDKYLDEIKAKQSAGMVEVRTPDGRLVDLETFEVEPPLPVAPKPHPPQDSIENDDAWGEDNPSVPEGKPVAQAIRELDEKVPEETEEGVSYDELQEASEEMEEAAKVFEEEEAPDEEQEAEEQEEQESKSAKAKTRRRRRRSK